MYKISDIVERKFTEIYDASEWLVETDTGWQSVIDVKQTIEYEVWNLVLNDGKHLECADNHIIFDKNMNEIFVKDLKIGDSIQTVDGLSKVTEVYPTGKFENMYDLGVDSDNHRYYTNDILSHNTTCAAGYLLWWAMFKPDQTILVAAHKFTGSQEIMQRIRFAYEMCPDFIRAGVVSYNKGSMDFDNGSRIVSTTTTENTGRGMSISLLYCLDGGTTVKVRDKKTLIEEDISLSELYIRLNNLEINFMFVENTLYEILTPDGWRDFKGIQLKGKKNTITLISDSVSVTATDEHAFFCDSKQIKTKDINIGDEIDGISNKIQINNIVYNGLSDVYDIIEVDHPLHQFIVNDYIITKNCDELSFLLPTVTDGFWASISPTLATGGKAIITSTPNTDEDLFAKLWIEANNRFDSFGNETEVGVNGFFPYTAHWSEHPDRDDTWAAQEIAKIGQAMFDREYGLQFVTFEETLINPIFLAEMVGINPVLNMGQSRWYKQPTKDNIYLVSLDPSLGTGGNSAGIQVFELPTMEQVAEWHHNLTPIQGQIKILKEILNYIRDCVGSENASNIYWSLENNTVGEAGLVCIKDIGEENFPGMFLCEPMRKGHVRKFRKGFNTTHRSKITAASRMKYLIESKKMKIYSKPLISELKTYIATGVSFKAKAGAEDDLVSALLLLVRMSQVLADWDPRVFEMMSVSDSLVDDDMEYPMPIYISSYG